MLPCASWIVTTGCCANAVAATELAEGCVVTTSFVAVPAAIVKAELVAEVNPLLAAVNVYVFARLTWQPAKVATPAVAFTGLVVQVSVAPAGVVSVSVMGAVDPVTVLPFASWIVTCGCVPSGVAGPAFVGCAVNATLVAVPGTSVTVAGLLTLVSALPPRLAEKVAVPEIVPFTVAV